MPNISANGLSEPTTSQTSLAGLAEPADASGRGGPRSYAGWLRFHAAALVMLGLVWAFDAPIFRAADNWYNVNGPVGGELHQVILSLAMFGQGLGMVMTVVLVAVFDQRRERAFLLILILSIAGLASSIAKTVVGRERPLNSKGATIVHGPIEGIRASRQQSFPSGHTTTAVTFAVALSCFYPHARLLFWLLAAGVGFNRVLTVAHYPSDIIGGAWLGYSVAHWSLARTTIWRCAFFLAAQWRSSGVRLQTAYRRAWLGVRRGWGAALRSPSLVVGVSLAIYWAGNVRTPLWDRDEPRFAAAAKEMLLRNDWIVPTFNGELRPDKPILVYWLMMSAYQMMGAGAFAARFFSGLAGATAVFTTYLLGRTMFDRRVALAAAWTLALSPMVVVESKLATADALLLACLSGAIACLWRTVSGAGGYRSAVGFWILLALAGLAKGPVAVGIVLATLAAYGAIRRDWSWINSLRWRTGLILVVAIVLPWCWAVQSATDGQFLTEALGRHVLLRSTTALENHHGFFGYYLVALLLMMSPWSWGLPWALRFHSVRWVTDPRIAFLLAWLVGPLLLFELVRTKLVHYYLPAYPAAALLLASAWIGSFENASPARLRIQPWMGRGVATAGVILGVLLLAFVAVFFPPALATPAIVIAVVLGGGLICSGLAIAAGRAPVGFRIAVASIAATFFLGCYSLLPTFGRTRTILEVAQRLQRYQDRTIALWLYRDPTLVLELGGPFPVIDPLRDDPEFVDARRLASEKGVFICPMTPDQFANMKRDPGLQIEVLETVSRWDATVLRRRDVHLVEVQLAPSAVAARSLTTRR